MATQTSSRDLTDFANVAAAREICAEARTILGANGILGEYPVMRHMANLESVYTYEGTHDKAPPRGRRGGDGDPGVQGVTAAAARIRAGPPRFARRERNSGARIEA